MHSRLLALTLLPLLMLQGRSVRKRTPRLPEAAGSREGVAGTGASLTLWIAGDSAAAGVGVDNQNEALSGQLVHRLASSFRVSWQCHAKTGYDANDIIELLGNLPNQRVDILVCSVGVNDAVAFRSQKRWLCDIKALHRLARSRFGVSRLIMSQIPPLQHFPALPTPLNVVLGKHAAALNQVLVDYAALHNDITVVDTPPEGVRSMMASDGFHPGRQGYQYWADNIAAHIRTLPFPRGSRDRVHEPHR